jgi:hypothetical protein
MCLSRVADVPLQTLVRRFWKCPFKTATMPVAKCLSTVACAQSPQSGRRIDARPTLLQGCLLNRVLRSVCRVAALARLSAKTPHAA